MTQLLTQAWLNAQSYDIIYMKILMMSTLTYLMTSLGAESDSEPKATNDLSPQTRLEQSCHRTVKPRIRLNY